VSRKPKRSAAQRARDIIEAITEIRSFVQGQSFEDFVSDPKTRKAVLADFAIIGEAASHLPPEITDNFPQVPWQSIRDLRKIVVHVYFGVDPQIIWDTIQKDLTPLETQVKRILDYCEHDEPPAAPTSP
jgi:uncharacterized protein with HEPN domain